MRLAFIAGVCLCGCHERDAAPSVPTKPSDATIAKRKKEADAKAAAAAKLSEEAALSAQRPDNVRTTPLPDKATLERSLRQFYLKMRRDLEAAQTPTAKVKVMEQARPQESDIAALFPGHKKLLSQAIRLSTRRMARAARNGNVSGPDFPKSDEAVTTRLIDCRLDRESRRYRKVLLMLPADVPVYRIQASWHNGGAGSSSYVYINDRWVFWQGLDSTPDILPELPEIICRARTELNGDRESGGEP